MGFGAEVAAVVQHQAFDWLDAPIERVGAKFMPIPFAPVMEEFVVPHADRRARGDQQDRGALVAVDVSLPRLGQGMEAGTIVRWLKSEGDQVEKGEALYELDTDKVTQEVEADASGVLLKILAGEGEEIEVGKRIAVIGEQGEEVERRRSRPRSPKARSRRKARPGRRARKSGSAAARPPPTSGARSEPAASNGGRLKASPLARRIARERGIELSSLTGTGPEGRIVAEDVERAATSPAHATVGAAPLEAEVVPLSSIRRTIANRLTKAWQAPVFQISMSADMTRSLALRERLRDEKVTVTDVLTKLAAIALLRHRRLNAHFVDDEIRIFPSANVGLAVATERGLARPRPPRVPSASRSSRSRPTASRSSSAPARPSSPRTTSRTAPSRSRTSGCTASRTSSPSSTRRRSRSSRSARSSSDPSAGRRASCAR